LKSLVESEAKTAVAALKADLENQIATLDDFKASVNQQLATIKEAIGEEGFNLLTNLDSKIATAEQTIAELQGKIAEIDANTQSINEIKNSLESLQTRINNAVEKVDNVNTNISTLNVFVDGALTSLVLKPTLYYGGIEAVEAIHGVYQPLGFSIYYQDAYTSTNGHQDGTSKVAYDRTTGNAWDITYEYNAKDDLIYKYPTIDAYYHVNPKYVKTENIGDLALNTEDRHYVNTGNTRAEKNSLCTALDVFGPRVYSYEGDGLLHTYFTNSADMWHRVEQYAHTVTVVSLEANAPATEGTRTVTSDWAAVARVHQTNYRIADNDAYILHYETYPHIYKPADTDCGMMDTQQYTWTEQHGSNTNYERDIVHVYRQAREAIVNEYTHLLKWDGTAVDLDSVIEVHADHHYYDAVNGRSFDFPVNLEKLGFERKYTVVDYEYPASYLAGNVQINGNATEQSQHAHLEGDHNQLLKANFVTNGKRDLTKAPSRASIGREPLVMIEIIDKMDEMTWNPDHMNWEATPKTNDPKYNLVAVGFIKFKIVDEDPVAPYQVINVDIDMQKSASVDGFSNMYAKCDGDYVLTSWHEVEEQILDQIKQKCNTSISKSEFETNYVLRGIQGEDISFAELASRVAVTGQDILAGQVYIPQTNKTSVIGTRQNWVDGFDGTNAKNWVMPQVVLNGDITNYDDESYWYGLNGDNLNYDNEEQRFVDPARYGNPANNTGIIYTLNDPLHRETDLIGVRFSAEQMLQQLVKRDHTGQYLDSLGNKVNFLSEADFYPYVLTKVAGKLVDPNHNGWPEITLTFNVKVNLNKAEMNRPARFNGNGNWYSVDGLYNNTNANKNLAFINANIDAFWNGAGTTTTGSPYYYDVRRFVMNLQQNLKGQKWYASTSDYTKAFDFQYEDLVGAEASKFIANQRDNVGASRLHGDLYFFTENWLGDLEEGTPYWHDASNTPTVKDDKFYADKYLIKVCYTANPLDTVVWAQEAGGKDHVGKLGKYLYAYKYIEDRSALTPTPANTLGDPTNGAEALVQNYSHYDMANGELIAWIDNFDTHQVDASMARYANRDLDNDINENVNIHYNFDSHFAQDLLNRAGRYAEKNTGTKDGYSEKTDNPFSAHVHLNLFEGDCIPAVNPKASEFDIISTGGIAYVKNDYPSPYIIRNEHGSTLLNNTEKAFYETVTLAPQTADDWKNFYHRPMGVPVMLNNPDFVVRFERPISVEFKTPWQSGAINGVEDAVQGACVATITYKDLFRNDGGTPTRTFPMDWRNYTLATLGTPWVQFYQGKNTGTFNVWNDHSNTRPAPYKLGDHLKGFKFMEADRSSWNRSSTDKFFNWNNWYYKPTTNPGFADSFNAVNVVPQVDHMLTNYGGTEGFYSVNASQINLRITHTFITDPVTGNDYIESTTFKYLNDNINRGAFDIIIPVTVKYAWGDITTTGRWQSTTKLQATPGNYYHNDNMNYIKVHFSPTIAN